MKYSKSIMENLKKIETVNSLIKRGKVRIKKNIKDKKLLSSRAFVILTKLEDEKTNCMQSSMKNKSLSNSSSFLLPKGIETVDSLIKRDKIRIKKNITDKKLLFSRAFVILTKLEDEKFVTRENEDVDIGRKSTRKRNRRVLNESLSDHDDLSKTNSMRSSLINECPSNSALCFIENEKNAKKKKLTKEDFNQLDKGTLFVKVYAHNLPEKFIVTDENHDTYLNPHKSTKLSDISNQLKSPKCFGELFTTYEDESQPTCEDTQIKNKANILIKSNDNVNNNRVVKSTFVVKSSNDEDEIFRAPPLESKLKRNSLPYEICIQKYEYKPITCSKCKKVFNKFELKRHLLSHPQEETPLVSLFANDKQQHLHIVDVKTIKVEDESVENFENVQMNDINGNDDHLMEILRNIKEENSE